MHLVSSKKLFFIFFMLFIAVVYLFTLKGVRGNIYPGKVVTNKPPFESSQERGRYAQVVALAELHTFRLDKFLDFVKPDLAWYNGHFYSAFPVGFAVLAYPFYVIGKLFSLNQVFTSLTPILFSLFTLVAMHYIGREFNFGKKTIFFTLVVFSLASVAWPYTVSISIHPVSAFIISLCFLMAIKVKKKKNNLLFYSIFWAGFTSNFFIDYPNMFILLPCVFYMFFKSVRIYFTPEETNMQVKLYPFWTFIFATPFLCLFFLFNFFSFGKVIALTNTYNLHRLDIQNVKYTYGTLSNSLFTKASYSQRFSASRFIQGTKILLVSTDRGLLFYSPIFILSFLGIFFALFKKNLRIILLAAVFLCDLFVYGSFDDPYGGWSFGPRYLIPTLPLMAIAAGYFFEKIWNKNFFIKIAILVTLLFSIGVSLSGALTTNIVPPKVEAIPLHLQYNYIYNFSLIFQNHVSSFFYNTFLLPFVSPVFFYSAILCSIFAFLIILLFWGKFYEINNKP